MRSRINSFTNARIETSTENDRCRHKITSVYETEPDPLSRVGIHDTVCIDFVIETEAILSVGEFIEIYQSDESFRTAVILWICSPLAGCSFIAAQNPDLAKFQPMPDGIIRSADSVLKRIETPLSENTGEDQQLRASSESMSIGVRIWIIIGSSVLLWGIISGLLFWVSI